MSIKEKLYKAHGFLKDAANRSKGKDSKENIAAANWLIEKIEIEEGDDMQLVTAEAVYPVTEPAVVNPISNLEMGNQTAAGATLLFDMADLTIDITVEIDKGSGFEALPNAGIGFSEHVYPLGTITSLMGETNYLLRLTAIGYTSMTLSFTTDAVVAGSFPTASIAAPSSVKQSIVRPAIGVTVPGDVVNTTITRVSPDGEGTGYPKRAALSIDNSRIITTASIRNTNDGSLISDTNSLFSNENTMSLVDSGIAWGTSGPDVRKVTIIGNVAQTEVWVSIGGNLQMGQFEGSISNNDQYMIVNDGNLLRVVDLINRVVLPNTYTVPGTLNGAMISQNGAYVLWVQDGSLMRANRDFTGIYDTGIGSSHGDCGVDTNGKQVYVSFTAGDSFTIIDLESATPSTQQITLPFSTGNGHISCRNILRPGVAYFSEYKPGGDPRIFAVILDGATQPLIEDWGFTRQPLEGYNDPESDYAGQAKLVVSADGSTIAYTSRWDGGRPAARAVFLLKYVG